MLAVCTALCLTVLRCPEGDPLLFWPTLGLVFFSSPITMCSSKEMFVRSSVTVRCCCCQVQSPSMRVPSGSHCIPAEPNAAPKCLQVLSHLYPQGTHASPLLLH